MSRGQCNAAHVMRIRLAQNLEYDAALLSGVQNRLDRRKAVVEAHVYDAPPHRHDDTAIL